MDRIRNVKSRLDVELRRETTGNEDQRYCSREEHDKARSWFLRKARAEDGKLTREEKLANLKRLRKTIDALDFSFKNKRAHG